MDLGSPSPRLAAVGAEEAAGRSSFGSSSANCGDSVLGDGLTPPMAVQIGCGKAWIDRVDLDAFVLKFRRQLHRPKGLPAANSHAGLALCASEPSPLDTLTIRAAPAG
jgi:hypothetical protein